MRTQLPQAQLWVAEILFGKKGASYSNQAALLGGVVALEGGKEDELMSPKDVDCTVCVPFISLWEEDPDSNWEKHATSSRLKV